MNLFIINYQNNEEDLCNLEIKSLFGYVPEEKYFFDSSELDIKRSTFIKAAIKIKHQDESLEKLTHKMILDEMTYKDFKVKFIDIEGKMEFNEKHRIEGIIGNAIKGEPKIHNPKIVISITRLGGKWIVGEYYNNSGIWDFHSKKPKYYSNALSVRLAKSIVNIAVKNDMSLKLVDPCCGIGTVLMEALSMGIDIEGYDINHKVVEGANDNLRFFGYPEVAAVKDIKELNKFYDVSILDLPYGILSIISREEQGEIIKNAARISNKMILVSIGNMDKEVLEAGFKVIDRCEYAKGKFKRYVTVCIRNE